MLKCVFENQIETSTVQIPTANVHTNDYLLHENVMKRNFMSMCVLSKISYS